MESLRDRLIDFRGTLLTKDTKQFPRARDIELLLCSLEQGKPTCWTGRIIQKNVHKDVKFVLQGAVLFTTLMDFEKVGKFLSIFQELRLPGASAPTSRVWFHRPKNWRTRWERIKSLPNLFRPCIRQGACDLDIGHPRQFLLEPKDNRHASAPLDLYLHCASGQRRLMHCHKEGNDDGQLANKRVFQASGIQRQSSDPSPNTAIFEPTVAAKVPHAHSAPASSEPPDKKSSQSHQEDISRPAIEDSGLNSVASLHPFNIAENHENIDCNSKNKNCLTHAAVYREQADQTASAPYSHSTPVHATCEVSSSIPVVSFRTTTTLVNDETSNRVASSQRNHTVISHENSASTTAFCSSRQPSNHVAIQESHSDPVSSNRPAALTLNRGPSSQATPFQPIPAIAMHEGLSYRRVPDMVPTSEPKLYIPPPHDLILPNLIPRSCVPVPGSPTHTDNPSMCFSLPLPVSPNLRTDPRIPRTAFTIKEPFNAIEVVRDELKGSMPADMNNCTTDDSDLDSHLKSDCPNLNTHHAPVGEFNARSTPIPTQADLDSRSAPDNANPIFSTLLDLDCHPLPARSEFSSTSRSQVPKTATSPQVREQNDQILIKILRHKKLCQRKFYLVLWDYGQGNIKRKWTKASDLIRSHRPAVMNYCRELRAQKYQVC